MCKPSEEVKAKTLKEKKNKMKHKVLKNDLKILCASLRGDD